MCADSSPKNRKGGFWTRFRGGLAHAFAVERGTEDELTAEEQETLDLIAARVTRMGMAVPAIAFLESMRPLNFIGSQVLLFFRPILDMAVDGVNVATSPLLGFSIDASFYVRVQQALEKRACVEALITRLEKLLAEEETRRKQASSPDSAKKQ